MRVLVLGAGGMLGSMVADVFARSGTMMVTAAVRSREAMASLSRAVPEAQWLVTSSQREILDAIDGHQWVVNAIGVTQPHIQERNADDVMRAIETNALLPHRIALRAADAAARVIQIATDGVFSGAAAPYDEQAPHDASGVYAQTKSLGETPHPAVFHLRCSIVGLEWRNPRFLVEWFRRQPPGAEVRGFANHLWNGVTTLHFARVCEGIVGQGPDLPHVQHLVPADAVSKAVLLRTCRSAFGRDDIRVIDVAAPAAVDRRLRTLRPEVNAALWAAAGYPRAPSVSEMLAELGHFDYRPGSGAAGSG